MKKIPKKQSKNFTIPKGYTQTKSDGMSATVDWDKTPVVEGKVLEIKTIPEKVGKDKNGKKKIIRAETRIMVIALKNGEQVAVWEKYQLASLFDAVEEGNDVYINHTGTTKVPGRKMPMHDFVTAFK